MTFSHPLAVRADGGNRTHDPEITNHVLWPTELHRQCLFPLKKSVVFLKGVAKIYLFLKIQAFSSRYFFISKYLQSLWNMKHVFRLIAFTALAVAFACTRSFVQDDYFVCAYVWPPFIMINAWNEWVEGSYLLPDCLNGYGYLEAVRDVFEGKYDADSYKACKGLEI